MKRILSLVLALSMILSMFSVAFAGSLKDVTGTNYEAAVEALMELGVVDGYPDGTFLPNNIVTRAELAKLLVTAYGLSQAAEVASKATPFSDVAGNWAAGYINVSADYKFVNGYPDGTFMPDETVTYAEAITMCLRVLGYANEIDAKGTWPTNYISKAQDLKLMKDVEYKSYNDGATRGNIANLIWKMLRTPMWETNESSEGDGLVSRVSREMINVKFSDYKYVDDAKFDSFSIQKDSKNNLPRVDVKLTTDDLTKKTWEYTGNDFYQFVPGTEVEVLVNTEEGTLLTIVPTGDDTLVNGTKVDLDEDYEKLRDVDYAYAYGIVESKEIDDNVTLTGESVFVDEVEVKDKKVILTENGSKNHIDNKKGDYMLILKDGERIALKDVKEGDILTTVTVSYNGKKQDTFYVVGGTSTEGKLTEHYDDKYKKSNVVYWGITVDGDEYILDVNAKYVEDPEKDKITVSSFYNSGWKDQMKKEEVTLRLDPIFGRVVRVEFDGKIDGGTNGTEYRFLGVTSRVKYSDDEETYIVDLMDADGTETYKFANEDDGVPFERKALAGSFAAVKLNDDGEIKTFTIISKANKEGSYDKNITDVSGKFIYGDASENEQYLLELIPAAKYDKDDEVIKGGKREYDVDDSVVVAILNYDDSDDDGKFTVEYATGIESIEKLKDEPAIVVYDDANTYKSAKVIAIFDNVSDKSDNMVGKVTASRGTTITVDGEDGEIKYTDNDNVGYKVDDVVVFTTKAKEDDLDVIKLVSKLTVVEEDLGYVTDVDGERYKVDGVDQDKLHSKDSKFEDYMFVVVTVDDEGEIDSVEAKDYESVALEDYDRISIDSKEEIFYIVRGFEERKAPTKVEYKVSVLTREDASGDYSGETVVKEGIPGEKADYPTELEGYTFDKVDPENPVIAKDLEVKVYFTSGEGAE